MTRSFPSHPHSPVQSGGFNVDFGERGHGGLLRQHQAFAFRFGDQIAELPRRFEPQVYSLADLILRRLLRVSV